MPTVDYTLSFLADAQGYQDDGNNASITFGFLPSDGTPASGCVQFTCATQSINADEFGLKIGTLDTWEILGVPTGATVSKFKIGGWASKVAAFTNATSHFVEMSMDTTGGGSATSPASTSSIASFVLPTSSSASWTNQAAGNLVNINPADSASNTPITLEIKYHLVTPAASPVNVDTRLDNITITTVYNLPNTFSFVESADYLIGTKVKWRPSLTFVESTDFSIAAGVLRRSSLSFTESADFATAAGVLRSSSLSFTESTDYLIGTKVKWRPSLAFEESADFTLGNVHKVSSSPQFTTGTDFTVNYTLERPISNLSFVESTDFLTATKVVWGPSLTFVESADFSTATKVLWRPSWIFQESTDFSISTKVNWSPSLTFEETSVFSFSASVTRSEPGFSFLESTDLILLGLVSHPITPLTFTESTDLSILPRENKSVPGVITFEESVDLNINNFRTSFQTFTFVESTDFNLLGVNYRSINNFSFVESSDLIVSYANLKAFSSLTFIESTDFSILGLDLRFFTSVSFTESADLTFLAKLFKSVSIVEFTESADFVSLGINNKQINFNFVESTDVSLTFVKSFPVSSIPFVESTDVTLFNVLSRQLNTFALLESTDFNSLGILSRLLTVLTFTESTDLSLLGVNYKPIDSFNFVESADYSVFAGAHFSNRIDFVESADFVFVLHASNAANPVPFTLFFTENTDFNLAYVRQKPFTITYIESADFGLLGVRSSQINNTFFIESTDFSLKYNYTLLISPLFEANSDFNVLLSLVVSTNPISFTCELEESSDLTLEINKLLNTGIAFDAYAEFIVSAGNLSSNDMIFVGDSDFSSNIVFTIMIGAIVKFYLKSPSRSTGHPVRFNLKSRSAL